MPPISGKKYLDQALTQIKQRTQAGEKVAVSFDIDNTLFDTRGRALAIGKAFDAANGTSYFKGKTAKQLGNDAKETAALVKMSPEHTRKFSAFFFQRFFKGENYKNDSQIRQTVELAKKAAAAGADVFYVTARTEHEEPFTIAQLQMKDKTPEYKAHALDQLSQQYDFVPWFITESRADIAGVQKLDTRVQPVLLETKFSGDRQVDAQTPIWKVDVK